MTVQTTKRTPPPLKCVLKLINALRPTETKDVSKTLSSCGIFLTSLKSHASGFAAITDKQEDIDKLLSSQTSDKLKKVNVYPIPPVSYLASRTLLVRGLDEEYGKMSNTELTSLVKQRIDKVEEVIQFPTKTRFIKLIFDNASDPQRYLREGIKIGFQRIPPSQLNKDTVITVIICYKCYALDSHEAKDCKATNPTCSNCSSNEHDFRTCTTPKAQFKCVNCTKRNKKADDHHTMSPKCPLQKEIVREKRTNTWKKRAPSNPAPPSTNAWFPNNRNIPTFGNTWRQRKTVNPPALMDLQISPPRRNVTFSRSFSRPQLEEPVDNDTQLKIAVILMDAHIAAASNGRSYRKIAQQALYDNLGILVQLPNHDSKKIVQHLAPNNFSRLVNNSETSKSSTTATPPLPAMTPSASTTATPPLPEVPEINLDFQGISDSMLIRDEPPNPTPLPTPVLSMPQADLADSAEDSELIMPSQVEDTPATPQKASITSVSQSITKRKRRVSSEHDSDLLSNVSSQTPSKIAKTLPARISPSKQHLVSNLNLRYE